MILYQETHEAKSLQYIYDTGINREHTHRVIKTKLLSYIGLGTKTRFLRNW